MWGYIAYFGDVFQRFSHALSIFTQNRRKEEVERERVIDREIVGVGRAIQKTFARAFLNSVGFYGCLQQIEGKTSYVLSKM